MVLKCLSHRSPSSHSVCAVRIQSGVGQTLKFPPPGKNPVVVVSQARLSPRVRVWPARLLLWLVPHFAFLLQTRFLYGTIKSPLVLWSVLYTRQQWFTLEWINTRIKSHQPPKEFNQEDLWITIISSIRFPRQQPLQCVTESVIHEWGTHKSPGTLYPRVLVREHCTPGC